MSWEIGEYPLQDGKVAVITHVQPNSRRPYVGYIKLANGDLKGFDWDDRGRWGTEELSMLGYDLPNAKHKTRLAGWVNVYRLENCDGFEIGPVHDTLKEASELSSEAAVARVKIQLVFDEGENL